VGVVVYTTVNEMYHISTLVDNVRLRQPLTDWPVLSASPWTVTSIANFWSFRWHKYCWHLFIAFGARPGGALLGPFGVSFVLPYVGIWGLERGTEFSNSVRSSFS